VAVRHAAAQAAGGEERRCCFAGDVLCENALHASSYPPLVSQAKWLDVKFQKKQALVQYLKKQWGFDIDPTTMFDMQIKRIHECVELSLYDNFLNRAERYKRQLLNALALIKRYSELKKASAEERAKFVRKTVFFAGKAAPGYFNAKCIIRLICGIAEVVNADPETNHYLKVFFVPNYNVTLAEKMIPASDLSQVAARAASCATRHTPCSTFPLLAWRPAALRI
jgi:starch phosphorylase